MNDVTLRDGGRVYVHVVGRGPPILLLRPVGGGIASWGDFTAALAAHTRVITFEPRGTGQSSGAPISTTTRSMAADALAVLDAVGVERSHVYGASLGGMVASWLAIDQPARVDRLVLASTALRGMTIHAAGVRRGLWLARCLIHDARVANACLATGVLSERFRRRHPDRVARIRAESLGAPASHRGLVTLLWAALRHDVRARIDAVHAPTLVLAGERDVFVPIDAQRALAERLAYGAFATVPECGHDISVEGPSTVAGMVLAHLAR
jgi:3-oxoadipate enol-lactonase